MATYSASAGTEAESLGNAVALDGDQLLLSDDRVHEGDVNDTGRVFDQARDPVQDVCVGLDCPCGNDDPSAGCVNSTGVGARLDAIGSTSVGLDDLVLMASGLPPNRTATLLVASGIENHPFDAGRSCLSSCAAYSFAPRRIDSGGSTRFGPGLVFESVMQGHSSFWIQAHTSWIFQLRYRDPASTCGTQGSNFTNGIAVNFRN